MKADRPDIERIQRLVEHVRTKMLAEIELLARTKGKITVECFPKGDGFDIDLTTKIR